jgi:predicted transcriptional regulator
MTCLLYRRLALEKNMKYRSRTDIVSQILDAANGGSTKTKIMYRAYLSYAQLKEYLSILIENGLLEYEDGQHKYKTTEKGIKFMRVYQHMDNLSGPLEQRI